MKMVDLKRKLDFVIGYVYGTYYDHSDILDEKEMRKAIDSLYEIYNCIEDPVEYLGDIKELVFEAIKNKLI